MSSARGRAVVCHGKKCFRSCSHEALLRALCKIGDVEVVRCQKICHGSVVAAELDGRLEWFEGIDSGKLCVKMKQVVAGRTRRRLPGALKKRRIKRLAGSPPRR